MVWDQKGAKNAPGCSISTYENKTNLERPLPLQVLPNSLDSSLIFEVVDILTLRY